MQKSKSLLSLFTLALVVPILIGGCFITDFFSKKLGENIGETILEKSSGADDVDVDDDSVKIETEDGTYESSTKAELPEGWPSDVPTHPDLTITYSAKNEYDDYQQYSVTQTKKNADVSALKDYFIKEFEAEGWDKQSEYVTTDYTSLAFKKGDNTGSVIISTYSGTTTVTIAVSTY